MRRIGLNLYGPCSKQAMKDEDLMTAVKSAGIDYVEPCVLLGGLTHDNPSFWTFEKFQNMHRLMDSIGLGVQSIHVVTEHIENCSEEIIKLAKEYGIKHFIVGMPNPLEENVLVERAKTLCAVASETESCGARILIHNNQPDTAVKINGKTALELLVGLCAGKVGMQLDLGWCAAGGEDPIAFLNHNRDMVESLHFKDFEKPGVSKSDVAIGSGTIDSKSAIRFATEHGIPMLIDQDSYADIQADLKKSYDFIVAN